ncbi:MAG TPA: stalk domain-containing protein [Candidatus Cryosericum sp.]
MHMTVAGKVCRVLVATLVAVVVCLGTISQAVASGVFVQVLSPADGATVSAPSVTITGKAFAIPIGTSTLTVTVKVGIAAPQQVPVTPSSFVTGEPAKTWTTGSITAASLGIKSGMPTPVTVTAAVSGMPAGDSHSVTFTWNVTSSTSPSTVELHLVLGKTTMQVTKTSGGVSKTTQVTLEAAPLLGMGNRTLVPLRAIVEAMGGTVQWDAALRRATSTLGATIVELTIDSNKANVNGKMVPIDANASVVPLITSGRTMLPLRFVAESLGAQVGYQQSTKAITITYTGH